MATARARAFVDFVRDTLAPDDSPIDVAP